MTGLVMLAAVVLLAPLVIAIVALVQVASIKRRIEDLDRRLASAPVAAAAGATEDAAAKDEATTPVAAEPAGEAPAASSAPGPAPPPPRTAVKHSGPSLISRMERELTSRWLVWLGAATLALAGVFLVRYAAVAGYLGPGARITGGVGLGIGLIAAGEWLRRRPGQRAIAAGGGDYVPAALVAGGLFTVFAAVYAGRALYGLYGPQTAFMAMAVTALAGFALAVLHGQLVAIVGLVGGYLTPALVGASGGSAVLLFAYLAVLAAATSALAAWRRWWLAGVIAVSFGIVWVFAWRLFESGEDSLVLIAFCAVNVALFAAAGMKLDARPDPPLWRARPLDIATDAPLWTAAAGAVVAGVTIIVSAGFDQPVVAAFAVVLAGFLGLGAYRARFDALAVLAAVAAMVVFAAWGGQVLVNAIIGGWAGPPADAFSPSLPGRAYRFFWWAVVHGAAFVAAGAVMAERARRAAPWLLAGIVTPLVLLSVAYARASFLWPDAVWAVMALALAAIMLAVTAWQIKQAGLEGGAGERRLVTGAFAAGVTGAVTLAAAIILREAWLTVALAVEVAAVAWIARRLALAELRPVALVLAVAVVVRVVANRYVFGYGEDHLLGDHWIIYGLGVPAVAFHFAYLWLKEGKDDYAVWFVEAARMGMAALLAAGEIHIWIAGSLAARNVSLLESALQALVWLGAGWSRWRAYGTERRPIDLWAAGIFTGLGAVTVLVVNTIFNNPGETFENIGAWPVFNTLFLAYGAPAVAFIVLVRTAPVKIPPLVRHAVSTVAVGLALLYLVYETRHVFQGPRLAGTYLSDGEFYTYSAVWLVFSFALLAAGLYLRDQRARIAALAVLLLVAGKVFLFDMAGLDGLLRVASFLALGLSLVGIGLIYQRLVLAPADDDEDDV